jgi:Transcriptional regulator
LENIVPFLDKMLDLNDIVVFARVVEAGSFTAAARLLGMPKTTVSRRIAALERRSACGWSSARHAAST